MCVVFAGRYIRRLVSLSCERFGAGLSCDAAAPWLILLLRYPLAQCLIDSLVDVCFLISFLVTYRGFWLVIAVRR